MTLYGPLLALVYLPTAIWSNVNFCLILSGLFTAIITITPTVFFLKRLGNNQVFKASAIGLFILAVCTMEGTRYSLFHAHADAPGLALASIGFFILCFTSPKNNIGLATAATALSLSVFGKQTLILAVIGALLLMLFLHGLHSAFKFLCFYSFSLALFTLLFGAWFGFETLWVHGIEIPSNHAWTLLEYYRVSSLKGKIASTAVESMNLLAKYGMYLLPPMILALYHIITSYKQQTEDLISQRFEKYIFGSLLFSFSLLPASAAGVAKIGGWINSESLFCMFVAISFSLSLPVLVEKFNHVEIQRTTVLTIASLLLVVSLSQTINDTARWQSFGVFLEQGDAQDLLKQAETNQYFFPSDPLVHIIEENRLLPNTDVVDSINDAKKQQALKNNVEYQEVKVLNLMKPKPNLIVYAGLDHPRMNALGFNDRLVPIKKLRTNNEYSFIIHSIDY